MNAKEAFQKLKGYVPLDWEETKLVESALNRLEKLEKELKKQDKELVELNQVLLIVREIAKSLNLTFYRNTPTISFEIKGPNELYLQEITFKDEWKYFLLKEHLE